MDQRLIQAKEENIATTERFVYHITSQKIREQIKRNGLLPFSDNGTLNFKNSIFANNGPYNPNWYPIYYDSWDHDCETFHYRVLPYYDVWRIDTKKIKNKWFEDHRVNFYHGKLHVYCHDPIPPSALKLFKISDGDSQDLIIKTMDGVTSISSYQISYGKCLVPVKY
jgi:hypothetical protein